MVFKVAKLIFNEKNQLLMKKNSYGIKKNLQIDMLL